ncbi:MAG: efflux RND transporter periplasmic adaptor subunit [Hyphomicrobiales bacterium]
MKRSYIILALVLTASAAGYWWFYGNYTTVNTVKAKRGHAAEVVYATGTVEPLLWAKITALHRKRIVEICKCEGKSVVAGEVLVRLDDAEERARLRQLKARLERVKADAERIKSLVERDIASRITYDEMSTQINEHEARIAAQIDRINDLELKAPIDGIVLRRDGEVGEIASIGPNDAIIWIGQPKPLQVVADINEDDISKVQKGQNVLLRHESQNGKPLRANVDRITPKGDPETKTFRGYLALPEDSPLMIGMSVEANIVIREAKNAILLPAETVKDDTVQAVVNDRVVLRTVVSGIKGTRFLEIAGGISEGEVVISPYNEKLKTNARVRAIAVGTE